MRTLSRFVHYEQGATMVEFALVTPVLLLIIIACLDFARALNAYVTITNASREGARYATLNPGADLCCGPDSIKGRVAARISPLDTGTPPLIVEAFYDRGVGEQTWPSGGIGPGSPVPQRTAVRVRVSYDWQAATSLVGSFFSASGQRTFASSSSMDTIR